MFLQELPEPEKMTSSDQLVLFVRRWCPANLELKAFEEVLLDESTVVELKTKVGCTTSVTSVMGSSSFLFLLDLQNLGVLSCRLVDVQHFGETCCLHLYPEDGGRKFSICWFLSE
jgi:hypothetical protein